MRERAFLQLLVICNGLLPAAMLGADAWQKRLGVNPTEYYIQTTGSLSLILLLLTLTVTPVRQLTGLHHLIHLRRTLGLLTFFYAVLHFIGYAWFDRGLSGAALARDLWNRPFIAVGFMAFLVLLALALTSSKRMVKRLGGALWQRLHRKVYFASGAALLHYWLSVKADTSRPQLFLVLLMILLGYRFLSSRRSRPINTLGLDKR